jgi:type II secretion system protein G
MLRKNNNRGILIHIRSQGGLTLIELMVVLVILGLLAGLVFQRFTPQIDKAKEQTAITQMEILGLALDNYRLSRFPGGAGQFLGRWVEGPLSEEEPDTRRPLGEPLHL